MKKKISALIAVIIIINMIAIPISESMIGVFNNSVITANATNDSSFNYSDADIFVADYLYAGAYVNGKQYISDSMSVTEDMQSKTWIWEEFAEELIIDNYIKSPISTLWNDKNYVLSEYVLDMDIDAMANWQKYMYIELLLDYINYNEQTDVFEYSFEKNVSKYAYKIDKQVKKRLGSDKNVQNILKTMTVEDAVKMDFSFELYDKFTTLADNAATVAKDCTDYLKRIAEIQAFQEASYSRMEFLEKLYNTTDDKYLKEAIAYVSSQYNKSIDDVKLNELGYTMLRETSKQTGNIFKAFLKDLCPSAGTVISAIEFGKAGIDFFFNTKEIANVNVKMTILYDMHKDIKETYRYFQTAYSYPNGNDSSAKSFINAYDMYLQFHMYANNFCITYLGENLINGIWNQLSSSFKHSYSKYSDFKTIIAAQQLILKDHRNYITKGYKIYNDLYNSDDDISYYNGTNTLINYAYNDSLNKYWIIFNEGSRNDSIEMSSFDAIGTFKVIWDWGITCQNQIGECNQYDLTNNGFKCVRQYPNLSDYATNIIASNVDIYDEKDTLIFHANAEVHNNDNLLENMPIVSVERYDGDIGENFIEKIGTNKVSRGNEDIDGNTYAHGLEGWIGRWNYTKVQGWVNTTFELNDNYNMLTGKLVLIKSYNTSNFDTTLSFYGDSKLLGSYRLLPESFPLYFSINLDDVKDLKISLYDNIPVEGGTSYGFVDLSLVKNDISDSSHIHSYTSAITKTATCKESGIKTFTCYCGDCYTQTIPKLTTHTFGNWSVTTAATCKAEGTETRKCSVCGTTETRAIAKTAHKYTTKVIAPTTTAQGYTLHTCSVCGDSYKDTYTAKLTPKTESISKATVTGISAKTYTGKAITQSPVVKLGTTTLKSGTDYTVAYKNNTKVGTATVTITGKGSYTGTISKTFKINAASIAKATVSGLSNKTYTGKAITQNPTVKLGSKTLKKGTDYTVTFKNNKAVGKATVTIKGKGNYTGSISKTFKINPKKTTLKTATSPKTKQLKVTYSKVSGVTGYQTVYSTSSKFTKATTKTASSKSTSKTISGLTKGKTYYVKVRTYKTVKGTKYYSGYSAVKKIKIK